MSANADVNDAGPTADAAIAGVADELRRQAQRGPMNWPWLDPTDLKEALNRVDAAESKLYKIRALLDKADLFHGLQLDSVRTADIRAILDEKTP